MTRPRACLLLALAAAWVVNACGGGGGGGTSSGAVDNSWLTFSPSTIEADTFAGEAVSLRVTATSTKTISGVINVGIIDRRGVIAPTVAVTPSGLTYDVGLLTASTLTVGEHTGTLEVRLCRDDPLVCAQPIEGSPWQVPYRFRVQAASNLTPIAPLPGGVDWATFQGNAAHTGFIDATLPAANFTRRWVLTTEEIGSLATIGDTLLTAPPDDRAGAVIARAEHDGAERWRRGGTEFYSGVATGAGRVWVVEEGILRPPAKALRGFDAANGSLQAEALLAPTNGPNPPFAPVVDGGSVFVATSPYAEIGRYRASDGALEWINFLAAPYGQTTYRWTPSIGGGRAVMFDYHRLWSADAATGANQGSIEGPNSAPGISGVWEVWGAPALGSGPLAFVSAYYTPVGTAYGGGRLVAFDLDTRTVAWSVGTTVRSNPVRVGNVVYASLSGGVLQAHDAATGAVLWRWDPPPPPPPTPLYPTPTPSYASTRPNQPLLVVGHHAFIGLDGVTHAIDLTTRQSVWKYPASGPMAVSANGTLFIAAGTRLHAVNLR